MLMENTKVLYVTQDLKPYTDLSDDTSNFARDLPLFANTEGAEIRILMPRFGVINERRHRLHEVVRLSGINIIIDDDDFPLIIKVASLPGSRMQVYFLENDDFFKRKAMFGDKEHPFFADNGDRMIFFCKGVMETVRKFGWAPDIIHCHGWMTSLVPYYLKMAYRNDPIFRKSKIIYTVYDNQFNDRLPEVFLFKATNINKGIEGEQLDYFTERTNQGFDMAGIHFADAVIVAGENIDPAVMKMVEAIKKPVLMLKGERDMQQVKEFYAQLH